MAVVYGLFISEEYLKNNTIIDENVDMKLLLPTIWMAQTRHIQEAIGTVLYNDLVGKIAPTDTLAGDDLTLVDQYIAPALLYWTLYHADTTLLYKYRNKSIATKGSDNATAVDFKTHIYLSDKHKDEAEWYTQRLIEYLCENSTLYPLYDTESGLDEIRPQSHAQTSTIFLGPQYQKKCKINQ